ncbi:UNVERIFIED_CONTAM: hypothetical protein GTU68_031978 [Idotea baltica]|nr:hypothetical protein [Idotea baltica]
MHQNPQTAYEEVFASNLICNKLGQWSIDFTTGFAKTGVVASIKGNRIDSGKSIGLRADMDALDILEENNISWKSKVPGKMHACGHDGHTAMLLGAAKYLSQTKNFNGTVHLIFQPAEEGMKGAEKMIKDGLFEQFPCDEVYGMHNWPYLEKGKIAMCSGPIMACVDLFTINIIGQDGHAAMPQQTIDPIVIGSQIVSALQSIVSRNITPTEAAVVSITNFNAGTGAFNVIPKIAELSGTVRALDQSVRSVIKDKIELISTQIADAFGAIIEFKYEHIIEPTVNDYTSTQFCSSIAEKIVGKENVDSTFTPVMAGEDFGALMQGQPGCFIMLGQGDPESPRSSHSQGLHTSLYDFNDDIVPIGIEYWAQIVEKSMPL